ncbi:IS110 family transposase [Ferrimonas balearica]|uniref:IS110 family transposase n=1 Tax=Ferrimonas balearica TaxID=44012 RepID=UPI001C971956|nr:IS110 family transposase [Ferrimonas balearica]MBY5980041.1 IS110 family transposase [Ferrimonas balearica]
MSIKVVGIDLAKHTFQVAKMQYDGTILSNTKVRRNLLEEVIAHLPKGTDIAMEACASSHHWGRTFQAMGHQVILLPPQDVKAMAKTQKNDANDAVAICETAFRPKVHPVPVKSLNQQDIKSLRAIRSLTVRQRTALANQLRGLAAEYGLILPRGISTLPQKLEEALETPDNGLTEMLRILLAQSLEQLKAFTLRIKQLERHLAEHSKAQSDYQRLLEMPGIGPIIAASTLSEIDKGQQFSRGRQFSAWIGLVPRQFTSGGIPKLGRTTKHGNRELRVLFIHGARSVFRHVEHRQDPMGEWLRTLVARRGRNKAIVALANKLARVCWHLLSSGERYDVRKAFAR